MLHRCLGCVLFVLACTAFAAARSHPGPAPADEYFGRMKMSILGIRNGLHDTTLRVGFDPRHAATQLGTCRWLQDSIEDWGDKYPNDSWLPGTVFGLERLYERMHSVAARAYQRDLAAWVHRHYRGSRFERAFTIAVR